MMPMPDNRKYVILDRLCTGFKKALEIRRREPHARIIVLDEVPAPRGVSAPRGTWEATVAESKAILARHYNLDHRQGVEVMDIDSDRRTLRIQGAAGRTYQESYDLFLS